MVAPRSSRGKKQILQPHRPQIAIDVPFKKGDKYVLLDVGGGTCDVACHEIMGEFAIAEVLHPSGIVFNHVYVMYMLYMISNQTNYFDKVDHGELAISTRNLN